MEVSDHFNMSTWKNNNKTNVMFFIFVIPPTFCSVVAQHWIWNGLLCSAFSNTTSFEQQLSDIKEEKCQKMVAHVNLRWLKNCFYWIRGRFQNNNTGISVLQDRRNDGSIPVTQSITQRKCVNTSNIIDFDSIRNAAIATLKTKNESTILRDCAYNCSEELPHGFFPLPFNADTMELDVDRFPQHWYSVSEFYSLTKGKVLFLRGNSLTRQLFQRVIMWIRSQSSFIEHFVHKHMIYGFDMELDYWEICDWLDISESTNNCTGSSEFWSVFKNRSEVSVMSLNHSPFKKKKNLPATSPDFLLSMVPEFPDRKYLGSIVQIGHDTPHWRVELIEGGSGYPSPIHEQDKNVVPGRTYLNLPMHLWSIRNKPPLPRWPTRNRVYLCSNKTLDDAHFQCGAYGSYPNKIFEAKVPSDHDCSDPFNLNVWQQALMFWFDTRIVHEVCNTSLS